MALARSKVAAKGQTSIPADIRKKFGIGPGSVLAWEIDANDRIIVRRVGRFTSHEIHGAVFGGKEAGTAEEPPTPKSLEDMRNGIRRYMRQRHGRPS